jgi:cytochrome P450
MNEIVIVRRAITRDPDVYPEPEVFRPERFLNDDGTLRDDATLTSVFGFGKRVCPGRHYVDATLFIVAATVLSVFRVERRHNTEGVPFDYTYSGGLVRYIERFLRRGFEN